jgi:hypothetical protein
VAADGETLEETERYVVVLKDGPAGEVAEDRDPRSS